MANLNGIFGLTELLLLQYRDNTVNRDQFGYDSSDVATIPYLLPVVTKQAEFAWHFAAGKLAAIEVHTPRAAEGEGCSASIRVQTLTGASATVKGKQKKGSRSRKW